MPKLLLTVALQTFMGLLLRDCYDFGIGNVPGPNLGIPLVIHQGRDTIEDTLRKAVAAAEEMFGRGKPSIIFVCLPVAGECAHCACSNGQVCTIGDAAGPALLTCGLGRTHAWSQPTWGLCLRNGVDKPLTRHQL